ncbi:MAG: hypothetical protein K0S25_670 [Bacillus sp. (in: firmicutes)]|nr:hypothetical protein [Bacillus sp. (in: firmicutes)]
MLHFTNKWKLLIVFTGFIIFFVSANPVVGEENHDELFVLIGDSLMKAKDGDSAHVSKNIDLFTKEWQSIKNIDSKLAKKVDQKLKAVQDLLTERKVDNQLLSEALSSLSSAVVQYEKEQNPSDKGKGKEKVTQLLPLIYHLKEAINEKDQTVVMAQYQDILTQWNMSEKAVHDESIATYGNIEKDMALIRIAITQDPPNPQKALSSLDDLNRELENFMSGKVSKEVVGDYSLADMATILGKAEKAISQDQFKKASTHLELALTIWPTVEGDVKTRDSKLYSDFETEIPTAISILNSKIVKAEKAQGIVQEMNFRLAPLMSKTDYTLWDASLILLREGLEGLLVVATLIAFLKKMGQSNKQKWIWIGVAAGILASGLLAIVINFLFSQITAASSREYIEGFTGVIAVMMMLTVGAWLHNKSNIGNWNKYIDKQMKMALAKGSLFSFSMVSFLSVFREGAETIIFYTGITPYISLQNLVLGVVLAIFILIIVGFAIIYFSAKIPIGLFFKVATILVYCLAFKILGISIHALQISKVLPTTTMDVFPFLDFLGIYPTWETSIIQLILVGIIITMTYQIRKKERKMMVM